MVDFDLDACLRVVPNRYELVLLAKARADDLISGANPLLEKRHVNEKPYFTSLKEIAEGFHSYSSLDEKVLEILHNKTFGVLSDASKTNDQFNENSLFAKSFSNASMGDNEEDEEDEDLEDFDDFDDEDLDDEDVDESDDEEE